jgi:hypothetical protein
MSTKKENVEAPQASPVSFRINDQTRQVIHSVIASKPFNSVFGITKAIEKDVILEEEANAIINAIGQFPYAEVAPFFNNLKDLFVPVGEEEKVEA